LYNNFIATYLRNRKNLEKLKNFNDAAPPHQQPTPTNVDNDEEEEEEETEEAPIAAVVVGGERENILNEVVADVLEVEDNDDAYEDIIDETTNIIAQTPAASLSPPRSTSSLIKRFIKKTTPVKLSSSLRLIKKNNTTAPAHIKLAPHTPPLARLPRQQFVLHNKPPIWNETSQVYQLDFGGRVTQESAKNFQIEYAGKQVMQFGRIDSNAYTLDFEWPFTTVQAFSIALANITQRLK
jgi:hypothetical protein